MGGSPHMETGGGIDPLNYLRHYAAFILLTVVLAIFFFNIIISLPVIVTDSNCKTLHLP